MVYFNKVKDDKRAERGGICLVKRAVYLILAVVLLLVAAFLIKLWYVEPYTETKKEKVETAEKMPDETEVEDTTSEEKKKTNFYVSKPLDTFPEDFADEYIYQSGVGAWDVILYVKPDGSFEGEFTDMNMGEEGEGHTGTIYKSKFTGKFDVVGEIDEYSYLAELNNVKVDGKIGSSYIEDEIKYVTTDACGIAGGENFVFHKIGTPVDRLNEKYIFHYFVDDGEEDTELRFKCIENVEKECFFYAYEYED